MEEKQEIRYCLYARKSSESDERQAMSIDSQIKEMRDLAKKDDLNIVEIKKESHSAKISGQRPVFMQLLEEIRNGKFNGILTWAPDRLSRNAGDLGMLVDLMDQEKLIRIKTYSQYFSNNPNEKFLLMILCSQAKLENDQKGINVRRGIRSKCEMGWRPGLPPIGYFNRSFAGTKDIVVDPERGHFVTAMFKKVADEEYSGRMIKKWFDSEGMTTRAGKKLTLSQIYQMLKNPFYYGEFEYPIGKGVWYQGAHEPLIDKRLFDRAQKKLMVPAKAKWGTRNILFRGVFKCAVCGSAITGVEKFRKRQVGKPKRHVYYYCAKTKNPKCKEKPIKEKILIGAINRYVSFMSTAHPQTIKLSRNLIQGMESYRKIQEQALLSKNINPKSLKVSFPEYAKYLLKNGTDQQKLEVVKVFRKQLYLHNKEICSAPLK